MIDSRLKNSVINIYQPHVLNKSTTVHPRVTPFDAAPLHTVD